MTEIRSQEEMLTTLRVFSPLRRVLLATAGTLQSTLAAYLGEPIDVDLDEQEQRDGFIVRSVSLKVRSSGLVACRATTEAEVEDPDVARAILAGELGLGQLLGALHRQTSFELLAAGDEGTAFWRRYLLEGPGYRFTIVERFPAALYP